MTATFRSPLGLFALGVSLAGGWGGSVLADGAAPALPLPEDHGQKGWARAHRVHYQTRPLWQDAQSAMGRKDYAAAYGKLREVLSIDPENNHARIYLVDMCTKLGRNDEGMALCDELLTLYPDYTDGYLNKAFLAIKAARTDLAVATFDALLHRPGLERPQRLLALQNAAELCAKSEKYDIAERYARQWAALDDGVKVRLMLVECAIRQKQWAAAVEEIDRALALTRGEPLRGELQLKRAFALVNLGRYRDADVALMQARERLPDVQSRLTIERQLGFNAATTTNPAAAALHFKAYLLESFDEAVARGYLDALVASEQWDMAVAEAKGMVKQPGLTPEFTEYVGCTVLFAYTHLGNSLGAYMVARQLAAMTGKPGYLVDAASAAERLNEGAEAARLYREALDKQFVPSVAMAYHYLLKRLGRAEEGVAYLQKTAQATDAPQVLRQAAIYELAQVCREHKQEAAYFTLMNQLLALSPEAAFMKEYAVHLYGAGRYEAAAGMFERYVSVETNGAACYPVCGVLADIQLVLQKPAEAVKWLQRAAELGPRDEVWNFRMARAEYALGEYRACIDRLLPLAGNRDVYHLYIGFSFYKLKMPGLALLHLNRVRNSESLNDAERFTLFSNRAYLQYDQDQDRAALEDLDTALSYRTDPDLEMVRLKVLTRLGRFEEAVDTGRAMIEARTDTATQAELLRLLQDSPDPDFRRRAVAMLSTPETVYMSEVCQTVGLAAFRLNRHDDAIRWFSRALEYEPGRVDTYYLRGLAWFKRGKFKDSEQDFVTFYDRAAEQQALPATFWGDLGILEGKLGDFDLGTAALQHSMDAYVADVDSVKETGYQFMKWNRNTEARAAFRSSVDFYDEILPYLEGTNAEEYAQASHLMRKEYTKVDKSVGLQAYISKTDLDAHTQAEAPVVQTIDGSLPSQAGIMGTYRPPKIGFRDERQLDVFGRVLANFEPHSWHLDEASYQGGAGVVYKPFITQNFNTSIERLFKIGDNAEDNWLWRNTGFWERGEAPKIDRSWWLYQKAYGEISYFLEDTKRWIYYVDGRLGPAFPLRSKMTLTVPRLLAIGRYQSNDETGLGTYAMVGAGADLRILEQERQYTSERWYLDLFADYVWGWFDKTPDGYDASDFHGVMFGFNFVK